MKTAFDQAAGNLPLLYLFGTPGPLGGASTKVAHLVKLLHRDVRVTVVVPNAACVGSLEVRKALQPQGIPWLTLKQLPKRLEGVALGICEKEFFSSGVAREIKARGLKLVWSNEMMFPFKGEEEAVKAKLIDRVLFVSDAQADAFDEIYKGVPSVSTGNYIDPAEFPWLDRQNEVFTIGRLSRADVHKFPLSFPAFYEEFGLSDVRYRVMAWSEELRKRYRWHRFGSEWDLLSANKEPACRFLHSLNVFVYPLGHQLKKS